MYDLFFISAYCSHGYLATEIELGFIRSCNSTATFEYLIFTDSKGLSNCSVHYDIQELFTSIKLAKEKWYNYLNQSGTITVGQLVEGHNYAIQLTCGDVYSKSINFSTGGEYLSKAYP